ncbi:MAG: low molecular weight protein-tyrosine-phosphatase [Prevotella sp.]|nr:low molecular weight protein-tyrosine-phosphatase [Prevotella sp.]
MTRKALLFVCLGNICRSPAAESVMKSMTEGNDNYIIDSAAIGPWHVGELPDSRMRRLGTRRGYKFESRARQVERADFNHYDYIIAMDNDNIKALNALARNDSDREKIICLASFLTKHPGFSTIPDPYYGGEKDFELALDLIEDACEGLKVWLEDMG